MASPARTPESHLAPRLSSSSLLAEKSRTCRPDNHASCPPVPGTKVLWPATSCAVSAVVAAARDVHGLMLLPVMGQNPCEGSGGGPMQLLERSSFLETLAHYGTDARRGNGRLVLI